MSMIPIEFDKSVMHQLREFEHLFYFKWDLVSDVLEFQESMENTPFGFEQRIEQASTNFYTGLIHKDDQEHLDTYIDALYSNGSPGEVRRIVQKFRMRGKNGIDYLWVELRMLAYYDESMPVMVFGAMRNINDEQIWQIKLQHQAEHDQLTGFLNKIALEHHAEDFLNSKPNRSALIIIDADNFKSINDTFGHLFGDAVLTEMAIAIRKIFRPIDFMGRIGGDEFVTIVREFPDEDLVTKYCTELGNELRKSYGNEDKQIPFSISMGIAFYPEHGLSYQELFAHADRALYESKANGRDQFHIYKPSFIGNSSVESTRDIHDLSDAQQKAFQDNMIEFVFKILFETNDPTATISWTLGMFGRQYNLDRVSIEVYDRIANRYSTDFEWLSPNGVSTKTEHHIENISSLIDSRTELMLQMYHPTPLGVMAICNDTREVSAKYQDTVRFFKLGSFAHIRITHGTTDLGSFCFESATPREFSDKEKQDLNVFSVLLGNILLVRSSDEKILEENTRLRDILDRMQEFVYVIDKETHEPVFFNQTIRQFLTPISTTQPCFKRFHNLDFPCANCPVERLSKDGNEYLLSQMNNWGELTETRTYNIDWEEGKSKFALIIQDPF